MELKKQNNLKNNNNSILRYIIISFLFVVLVVVAFFGVQWFSDSVGNMIIGNNHVLTSSLQTSSGIDSVQASNTQPPVIHNTPSTPSVSVPLPAPMGDLVLGAQSALTVQVDGGTTKTLFSKNEQEILPIASLTKLMTALVVLDNYNLSQNVTIDQAVMDQEGEQGDLKLGQTLSVRALLYITLIESSNRSAYALSEVMGNETFIETMNYDAQKLGLKNTHYDDVAGLSSASTSTVKDLATLTQYLFENYPLFKEIIGLKQFDLYLPDGTFGHTLINTNELLGQDNIIGGKTGFTDDAQGCLMVIQKGAKDTTYIINILLGSKDRFGEMETMMHWIGANNSQ